MCLTHTYFLLLLWQNIVVARSAFGRKYCRAFWHPPFPINHSLWLHFPFRFFLVQLFFWNLLQTLLDTFISKNDICKSWKWGEKAPGVRLREVLQGRLPWKPSWHWQSAANKSVHLRCTKAPPSTLALSLLEPKRPPRRPHKIGLTKPLI